MPPVQERRRQPLTTSRAHQQRRRLCKGRCRSARSPPTPGRSPPRVGVCRPPTRSFRHPSLHAGARPDASRHTCARAHGVLCMRHVCMAGGGGAVSGVSGGRLTHCDQTLAQQAAHRARRLADDAARGLRERPQHSLRARPTGVSEAPVLVLSRPVLWQHGQRARAQRGSGAPRAFVRVCCRRWHAAPAASK